MSKIIYILLFVSSTCLAQFPQMLNDTSFSNGTTDWSVSGGMSISDDTARFTSGGATGHLSQADGDLVRSIQPDSTYTIEFDILTETGAFDFAYIAIRSTN